MVYTIRKVRVVAKQPKIYAHYGEIIIAGMVTTIVANAIYDKTKDQVISLAIGLAIGIPVFLLLPFCIVAYSRLERRAQIWRDSPIKGERTNQDQDASQ